MKEEKKHKRKATILMIVGVITLIALVVGATYAYFAAQVGKGDTAQINAQAGTTDSLSFNISDIDVSDNKNKVVDESREDSIIINANQSNFGPNGNSIGDGVKLNAHLIAGDDDKDAHFEYYVYLQISTNNLEYTTPENTPELVLVVQDPTNGYIDEIEGLTKSEITLGEDSIPCFDITKASGLITIASKYQIDATSETNGEADQNWQVKVIFKNLETDQHLNTNKTFQANLSIQSESINYLDLESNYDEENYEYTDYRAEEHYDDELDDYVSGYNGQIKNVSIVNYIADEEELNSIAKWDLSSSKDGSIMGWLKANQDPEVPYDLYIGSNLKDGEKIKVRSFAFAFQNLFNVETIDLNPSILDTSNLTDTSYMFNMTHNDSSKLKTIKGIENLDISNVENISHMFSGVDDMITLDISSWNTHNVTNMSHLFEGMTSLTEIIGIEDLDVSNVIDMSYMFAPLNLGQGTEFNSVSLNKLDLSNWKVDNVQSMSGMFEGINLNELNIIGWNTHNVTDMSDMFGAAVEGHSFYYGSSSINNLIGIGDLDVSNVTDMSGMFKSMKNPTTLDLSEWNVEKVQNMSEMFQGLRVNELNISGWKTNSVIDMSDMFGGIHYDDGYSRTTVKNIIGIENLDVSNVENMSAMFQYMDSPTTLDLSNWDTSKVTDMSYMFYGSSNLTSIDMRKATFSQVNSYNSMFSSTNSALNITITGEENKEWLMTKPGLDESKITVLPEQ